MIVHLLPCFVVVALAGPGVTVDSLPRADSVSTSAALGDSVIPLPEVRVAGERAISPSRQWLPTSFASDLPAGRSGRALETLAEVLDQAPGVRTVEYGGLGSFSTVSLRGAPASEVAVYLDGAPITSAAHSIVNLSDLPLTAIERVEVYRGLSPLGLGAATPGGAINLITGSGTSPYRARIVRGSYDTWEGRVTAAPKRGPLAGLLHFGYQGSDGDFTFLDDNGTPLNPRDDADSVRRNNRFDATTLLGGLTWTPAPGWVARAREDWFRKAQGVPGRGAIPTWNARLELERSLTQVELTRVASGLWPASALRGSIARERSQFRDTKNELYLGYHDTDDRFADDNLALELGWTDLPGRVALCSSGSFSYERAALTDAADAYLDPPPSERHAIGAAFVAEWRPWNGPAAFHAGQRWDTQHDHLLSVAVGGRIHESEVWRTLSAPQAGVRVALPLRLEARANWTRAARAPEFLELFGNSGSVMGNPALLPETAETWDAGALWATPPHGLLQARAEWAHYVSHAQNLVVYVKNSQNTVLAQNISRAFIRGDELTLRTLAPAGFEVSAALTLQKTQDRGDVPFWFGKVLPLRPERHLTGRLDWRGGPVHLGGDVEYLSEDFLDRYNRQPVPSRTLWGATASIGIAGEAVRLAIQGKNLGDNRVADVAGYPLPGRTLFVSCETRLGPAHSSSP